MNKTLTGMIAAGSLMFVVTLAHAQGGMPPPGGGMGPGGKMQQRGDWMFSRMDANNDGVVTKAEFEAFHAERFKEMDANHDGKITREEMQDFHQKQMRSMRQRFQQHFDAADANHDGALNKEEAKSMPFVARNFEQIDANHDGKVTQDEIRAYHDSMMGGPGGGMRHRGGMMPK